MFRFLGNQTKLLCFCFSISKTRQEPRCCDFFFRFSAFSANVLNFIHCKNVGRFQWSSFLKLCTNNFGYLYCFFLKTPKKILEIITSMRFNIELWNHKSYQWSSKKYISWKKYQCKKITLIISLLWFAYKPEIIKVFFDFIQKLDNFFRNVQDIISSTTDWTISNHGWEFQRIEIASEMPDSWGIWI